ncbi:Hsp20/alpha crystallin family protein [Streptomyces formicae]|uniref:Heat shock protein Hsp20 n=1 Tax=Streptomyces formicae TaxID=1616117 RepID=A0A291QKJ5_9ACTN|nr:Hsp20/alpha crystallin family protein [Streptomyces formicae]ATL32229.1 heat shock protein Hsp20 [Streptomyces formicae]
MSSMINRLPNWPQGLPDVFGWIEGGIPGLHPTPGVHGIRIEESCTDGVYSLRAELPGVDPDKDIDITVTEGVLTLCAERSAGTAGDRHSEFRYGTFARAVRLPSGARGDEATAEYEGGVLTITVPVPEGKHATRTIPVRHT